MMEEWQCHSVTTRIWHLAGGALTHIGSTYRGELHGRVDDGMIAHIPEDFLPSLARSPDRAHEILDSNLELCSLEANCGYENI